MQILRDLIESFLEHILKFSGSKFESQNFSSTFVDKTEISLPGNRKINDIQGILFSFWDILGTLKLVV